MVGKNNKYLKTTKEGTKVESYFIKKSKVGTASVVIGANIFLGAGAVSQAAEEVTVKTAREELAKVKEVFAKADATQDEVNAKVTTNEGYTADTTELRKQDGEFPTATGKSYIVLDNNDAYRV